MSVCSFDGFGDDAIVHVREVHHLGDAETARSQEAPKDVLEDEGAKIADVREVIHRGTAGVDVHLTRMERYKGLLAAAERIMEDNFAHVNPGRNSLRPAESPREIFAFAFYRGVFEIRRGLGILAEGDTGRQTRAPER